MAKTSQTKSDFEHISSAFLELKTAQYSSWRMKGMYRKTIHSYAEFLEKIIFENKNIPQETKDLVMDEKQKINTRCQEIKKTAIFYHERRDAAFDVLQKKIDMTKKNL